MTHLTKEAAHRLIDDLRSIAPKRPLSYGEAIQVARRQAARLRRHLQCDREDINLIWLWEQQAVPVRFAPSADLEESGLTTDQINGRIEILINQEEPTERQRFTLSHELKHVIDFYDADLIYTRLGTGDNEVRGLMIEAIANEFAAHLLMPTILVKRLWAKTPNLKLAAAVFNVSLEAMQKRLTRLGLIGEPKPRPQGYFRRADLRLPAEQLRAA
jgi:predicted transcriptional regulator